MTLSLTNRCNFRCAYCHIPSQKRAELSCEEWLGAIDELHAGGMGRASLIGGEPLLYKEVGRIVRHLERRGVHVSMNTNGWLVPERIDDLAGLDLVCITLDGSEAIHDGQRRRGSHARVLRALDTLRGRGVPVVTMTVLTAQGIDHVDHVLAMARAHGVTAWFQLEHDAAMDVTRPIAPQLTQNRIAVLARHLAERKRSGDPVGNSFAALERQAAERYLLACDDCHAGSYYGYMFSDGTVSQCLLTQAQVERENGRSRGYARAFAELSRPQGPGCACVPSFEVNRMLDLDPSAIRDALRLALGSAHA